jgi:hypothetical protein
MGWRCNAIKETGNIHRILVEPTRRHGNRIILKCNLVVLCIASVLGTGPKVRGFQNRSTAMDLYYGR